MATLDGGVVEMAVNRMARQPVERLGEFVGLFSCERFLWDYLDDAKLWVGLNQVLRAVKLPPLAEGSSSCCPVRGGSSTPGRPNCSIRPTCRPHTAARSGAGQAGRATT